MIGYGNSMFLATHGILAKSASGAAVDPDAQAFITAASITDPTQQSAINTLVTDLKGYGIWTKMKALYPFVGGTAAQHKWNLKDPRDLDAAFRLVFSGGWTHSANGATPNGTNAYADTKLAPSSQLSLNNASISYYSRTSGFSASIMGASSASNNAILLAPRYAVGVLDDYSAINCATFQKTAAPNTLGLFTISRIASTNYKGYQNGTQYFNSINASSALTTQNIYIGARNMSGSADQYGNLQTAFASIGDGLTDTEAANFYTAVQAFQVSLGRSIGTQTVSDADAQAFVTNAGIVDQVEANAINNLVIGLKADSLWTKMKACYPMVGGSSSTMKYNLKNPLDTDAAFRLVFNGGWTFSSNGALPNGTNAYADTFFVPSTHLGVNSNSVGYYSGTNLSETSSDPVNMGSLDSVTQAMALLKSNTTLATRLNASLITYSTATMRGFFSASRQSATLTDVYLNGSQVSTGNSGGTTLPTNKFFIGTIAIGSGAYASGYVKNDFRFVYLSDGLDDTESANLYSRVQTFNTALNRNV